MAVELELCIDLKRFLSSHYWTRHTAVKTTTWVTVTRNKNMRIMAHVQLDYRSKHTVHICIATA